MGRLANGGLAGLVVSETAIGFIGERAITLVSPSAVSERNTQTEKQKKKKVEYLG